MAENILQYTIEPYKKYAVFSGRARRKEFWYFYFAVAAVKAALELVYSPIAQAFLLLSLVPLAAVSSRRLQDRNISGWWLLAFAFSLVFLFVFTFLDGAQGAIFLELEQFIFGFLPVNIQDETWVAVVGFIAAITIIIYPVLMLLPSVKGENQYGLDPIPAEERKETKKKEVKNG